MIRALLAWLDTSAAAESRRPIVAALDLSRGGIGVAFGVADAPCTAFVTRRL
jgi:predicted phosphoribosyltransferase